MFNLLWSREERTKKLIVICSDIIGMWLLAICFPENLWFWWMIKFPIIFLFLSLIFLLLWAYIASSLYGRILTKSLKHFPWSIGYSGHLEVFHRFSLTPCRPSNTKALHISQFWHNPQYLRNRRTISSSDFGVPVWIVQTPTILMSNNNVPKKLTRNQTSYEMMLTIFHFNNANKANTLC
mgnify:CR=1 FL=1